VQPLQFRNHFFYCAEACKFDVVSLVYLFSYFLNHLSSKKVIAYPISSKVFPALSCTSFKVSALLMSLIHFELMLVQGDKHGSSFSFLHADIQFSQKHLLKSLSFLHCTFLVSSSKIKWVSWIHIWVFHSVPLILI
jgi:hypothetical protein